MNRVELATVFRRLVAKGVAPDEALKIITREVHAGALVLYCTTRVKERDASGNVLLNAPWADRVDLMPRSYVRSHLYFRYRAQSDRVVVLPVNPMEVTPRGPLIGVLAKARSEVDRDQAYAVIANPTKPQRQRARRKKSLWMSLRRN